MSSSPVINRQQGQCEASAAGLEGRLRTKLPQNQKAELTCQFGQGPCSTVAVCAHSALTFGAGKESDQY